MGWLEPDLATLGAASVYLVVFGFVFVESGLLIGLVLPGDSLLFTAGLLSARESSGVELPWLVAGVLVAAVTGDAVGYLTGRRLGRPWLERRVAQGRLNPAHLRRADAFYERYGWGAVVVARFIPWVRTVTPIVAGASRMTYRKFGSANVVGALVWGAGLTILGHYAATLPWVRTVSYAAAGFFIALTLVVPLVGWLRNRRAESSIRRSGPSDAGSLE